MSTFSTLANWLTYLETAHPILIDMGLERVGKVKQVLGLGLECQVITVAGTNGKGSTCALIESILVQAGYRVGCYTSPHLLSFNERARIQGKMADDAVLLPHFEAVEHARTASIPPVSLTYFEFTTLAILHYFASHSLDAVILEVGLGGRLDATNIIDTDCAIITSIDLDHTDLLGNTREKIGFEKAGIFRAGKPAICGDPMPPHSLIQAAQSVGADLWLVGRDFRYFSQAGQERWQWRYTGRSQARSALAYPALRGANQLLNACTALAALESLHRQLPVSARDIRLGFAHVQRPGCFQVLPGKPVVVLDVAHNPHAVSVLAHNLDAMGFFPVTHAVFGAMKDKDILGMIEQIKAETDYWYLADLPTPRAARAEDIEMQLRQARLSRPGRNEDAYIQCFKTVEQAYTNALAQAKEDDRIIVFGSFYTVAGVMLGRVPV